MPRGGNEEENICFFPIERTASPAEVQAAYDRHNLVPDPEGVARVNEDDPSFADQRPNACQWQDDQGRWNYAVFYRWRDGGRAVSVNHNISDWNGDTLFGGRRKKV